jgi:hypothetical protein
LGYKRVISTLRCMIRSRILIGFLCHSFLLLSIWVIPESCNALERERSHKNHFRIVPGINGNLSSVPRIPHEDRCSCSFPGRSCCMGPMNSTPKNSHISLVCGDNLRRLSVLQAAMIKPFDHKPLIQKDRCFYHSNSLDQREVFLVNCTLLI